MVNPEREFGERFANRLAYEYVVGELPLGEDLVITELRPPESFVGRTLAQLALPQKYGITVVAVRREGGAALLPNAREPMRADDIIVTVSRRGAVRSLMEKV